MGEGPRPSARYHNPAHGAKTPATRAATLRARHQFAAERGGAWPAWIQIYAATGARRGEVLALRWEDIDLDSGSVSITANLGTDRCRGDTKTVGSIGTVTVDATTLGRCAPGTSGPQTAPRAPTAGSGRRVTS